MIEVNHVKRYYKIAKQSEGRVKTLRHLFHRQYEIRKAVDDVSFSIQEGEIVGFIGPNGAGKSTTIKMLSGILYPDEGEVVVGGFVPYMQRRQYVGRIGVVFGQKSQLNWDLPLIESFELMKYIYKIPKDLYEKNLSKFTRLLDMEAFLHQPVRQLSLGQRMRGDIAAALLHSPRIVFFDEPTIGLDVIAKEKIRDFIRHMNETEHTTIIFTTHDLQDIEKVCKRLIIIDAGKKIYDGSVDQVKRLYSGTKQIELIYEDDSTQIKTFDTDKEPMSKIVEQIFRENRVKDISVREPGIDEMIRDIYEGRVDLMKAEKGGR